MIVDVKYGKYQHMGQLLLRGTPLSRYDLKLWWFYFILFYLVQVIYIHYHRQ